MVSSSLSLKIVAISAIFFMMALSSAVNTPYEEQYSVISEIPVHPNTGFEVSTASGDVYDGTGDWVISQPTFYSNNLSIIVNGDVIIQSGGSLVLEDSAIHMNVTGSILDVGDGGYLKGIDSYLLAESGGDVITGDFSMEFYGNVSWSGGYFRHFSEITFDNSTLNATFVSTDFAYATGRFDIRNAHSVSFSGCDFYEITIYFRQSAEELVLRVEYL